MRFLKTIRCKLKDLFQTYEITVYPDTHPEMYSNTKDIDDPQKICNWACENNIPYISNRYYDKESDTWGTTLTFYKFEHLRIFKLKWL